MTLSIAQITGSGTVTQSGTTVTGTTTSFLGEAVVGDTLVADAGSPLISGTITAIASATSLTLDTSATQGTGQTYKITPVAGSSDRVGQINDLSGLGNNATQATQINKPALKVGANGMGGRPTMLLDNLLDGMVTTLSLVVPYCIAVAEQPVGNGGRTVQATTENSLISGNRSGGGCYIAATLVSTFATGAGNHEEILNVPSDGAWYYVDGIDRTTTTGLTGNWTTFALGASGGTSEAANSRISAVFAFNRALTPQERRKLELYLGRKYGITV